jgi:hypothetical protein
MTPNAIAETRTNPLINFVNLVESITYKSSAILNGKGYATGPGRKNCKKIPDFVAEMGIGSTIWGKGCPRKDTPPFWVLDYEQAAFL